MLKSKFLKFPEKQEKGSATPLQHKITIRLKELL